jgi:Fe-S-cluster containining protein
LETFSNPFVDSLGQIRIMLKERNSCIRCGECCMHSTPSLQMDDLPLVLNGHISRHDLFTVRAGEMVRDTVFGEIRPADEELIKVRDRGGACVFYDDREKRCTAYHHRPVQCAALECWDSSKFMKVYANPKARREDLVEDGVLRGLIREHEKKCAYETLESLVQQITSKGEAAVEQILEILKFDYYLRPFVCEKQGIAPDEMDFFFGRPLVDTISQYGLQVIRPSDGSFLLTTLKESP